ncbi:MAG: chemotaxis protein CheW [Gemmatimonadaceae bacterium]
MPQPKRRPSPRQLAAVMNAPAPAAVAGSPAGPPADPVETPPAAPAPPAPPAAAAVPAMATPLSFAERVRTRVGRADLLVFRVGGELFGTSLAAVEEAVELPKLSPLPEMPPSMLGIVTLRGSMLPAYSPARPLGVTLASADAAALVVRVGGRRATLAVDDVDDVMTLDLAQLRPAPAASGERDASGIALGVARRGTDLVTVLDADALLTACLTDQALETA